MAKGNRIKIRIAVAVDDRGNWGCGGASGMSSSDALDLAIDGVESGYYRLYWLHAEVDAPKPLEVHIALPAEAIEEAGRR